MRLLDPVTRQTRCTLQANDVVSAIAFSPDSRTIAVGDWENRVTLWHAASGQRLGSFQTEGVIISLDFSRDGSALAAGSGDGSITVWYRDGSTKVHYLR